jgi:hypothetical protein
MVENECPYRHAEGRISCKTKCTAQVAKWQERGTVLQRKINEGTEQVLKKETEEKCLQVEKKRIPPPAE